MKSFLLKLYFHVRLGYSTLERSLVFFVADLLGPRLLDEIGARFEAAYYSYFVPLYRATRVKLLFFGRLLGKLGFFYPYYFHVDWKKNDAYRALLHDYSISRIRGLGWSLRLWEIWAWNMFFFVMFLAHILYVFRRYWFKWFDYLTFRSALYVTRFFIPIFKYYDPVLLSEAAELRYEIRDAFVVSSTYAQVEFTNFIDSCSYYYMYYCFFYYYHKTCAFLAVLCSSAICRISIAYYYLRVFGLYYLDLSIIAVPSSVLVRSFLRRLRFFSALVLLENLTALLVGIALFVYKKLPEVPEHIFARLSNYIHRRFRRVFLLFYALRIYFPINYPEISTGFTFRAAFFFFLFRLLFVLVIAYFGYEAFLALDVFDFDSYTVLDERSRLTGVYVNYSLADRLQVLTFYWLTILTSIWPYFHPIQLFLILILILCLFFMALSLGLSASLISAAPPRMSFDRLSLYVAELLHLPIARLPGPTNPLILVQNIADIKSDSVTELDLGLFDVLLERPPDDLSASEAFFSYGAMRGSKAYYNYLSIGSISDGSGDEDILEIYNFEIYDRVLDLEGHLFGAQEIYPETLDRLPYYELALRGLREEVILSPFYQPSDVLSNLEKDLDYRSPVVTDYECDIYAFEDSSLRHTFNDYCLVDVELLPPFELPPVLIKDLESYDSSDFYTYYDYIVDPEDEEDASEEEGGEFPTLFEFDEYELDPDFWEEDEEEDVPIDLDDYDAHGERSDLGAHPLMSLWSTQELVLEPFLLDLATGLPNASYSLERRYAADSFDFELASARLEPPSESQSFSEYYMLEETGSFADALIFSEDFSSEIINYSDLEDALFEDSEEYDVWDIYSQLTKELYVENQSSRFSSHYEPDASPFSERSESPFDFKPWAYYNQFLGYADVHLFSGAIQVVAAVLFGLFIHSESSFSYFTYFIEYTIEEDGLVLSSGHPFPFYIWYALVAGLVMVVEFIFFFFERRLFLRSAVELLSKALVPKISLDFKFFRDSTKRRKFKPLLNVWGADEPMLAHVVGLRSFAKKKPGSPHLSEDEISQEILGIPKFAKSAQRGMTPIEDIDFEYPYEFLEYPFDDRIETSQFSYYAEISRDQVYDHLFYVFLPSRIGGKTVGGAMTFRESVNFISRYLFPKYMGERWLDQLDWLLWTRWRSHYVLMTNGLTSPHDFFDPENDKTYYDRFDSRRYYARLRVECKWPTPVALVPKAEIIMNRFEPRRRIQQWLPKLLKFKLTRESENKLKRPIIFYA